SGAGRLRGRHHAHRSRQRRGADLPATSRVHGPGVAHAQRAVGRPLSPRHRREPPGDDQRDARPRAGGAARRHARVRRGPARRARRRRRLRGQALPRPLDAGPAHAPARTAHLPGHARPQDVRAGRRDRRRRDPVALSARLRAGRGGAGHGARTATRRQDAGRLRDRLRRAAGGDQRPRLRTGRLPHRADALHRAAVLPHHDGSRRPARGARELRPRWRRPRGDGQHTGRHRRRGHRARVSRVVPPRRRHAARRASDHLPRRALVSPDARGGCPLVRRIAVVGALALLAGCAYHPTLPKDHKVTMMYVALGDSTVEGVGATSAATTYPARLFTRLRAIYPRAGVINLGVAGATSADVVKDQLDRAMLMRPKLVTLSVGPNDITDHVPVAAYEANVGTIFQRCAREYGTVVVVNLLPDLAVTPRFRGRENEREVAKLTVAFNAALTRQARLYGVEVV